MKKLAIVITHPIQYYAPWFKLLEKRKNLTLKVFYTWSQSAEVVKDKTFGRDIKWDIPLLEGYDYEFMQNTSKKPGSHHFFGIDCPNLIPKIEKFMPDAILFFGWNFKSHLKAMRYFHKKVPVLFRGDSTLLDERGGFKSKLRRLVLKIVYSYVDSAFYVGAANKDYFFKHGLKEHQLIYAPHAIDNKRFSSGNNYKSQADSWKRELGYGTDDLVIVFAGKFESKKQPDFLIEAVLKANRHRKQQLHLLMLGSGPMEEELKLKSENQSVIKFLPFQNQSKMPLVYRLGDVFILPSKGPGETWGLAVNESMASNVPVIVSNKVGCYKDLVDSGKTGFVFTHDDIEDLIKILKDVERSKLNEMTAKLSKKIEPYNFENIVKPIENYLNEQ